jgi:hypothetical protein
MSKRKRKQKKKLTRKNRLNDAKRWITSSGSLDNLVESYSKRYGVSNIDASDELMEIGYYDDILIQEYEKEGVKWEYKVDPLSGDMFVVPEGCSDKELYEYHPIL